MTYRVNGSTNIAIYIEGSELPLDTGNALHTLHIVAGGHITLPALHFVFTDLLKFVPNMDLQDGSLVEVVIEGIIKSKRSFRVASWSRVSAGDGYKYTVDAYWDAPRYWIGTTCATIRGSSYDVLASIASECGLGFYKGNTPTSDTMLWVPGNSTLGRFARDTARYGYADDSSLMALAVDSLGVMRYLDISKITSPSKSVGFTPPENDTAFQLISDFKPDNQSGLANYLSGYRHRRYIQTALGDTPGLVDYADEITTTPDSKYPLLNTAVRDLQERGNISYAPIDYGNVHDHYERARYQNNRFNMMHSVQGQFLFPYQTDYEFGDNFNYVNPAELNNKTYDGEFTVNTKVVFISGSDYQEKIIALKQGIETGAKK